MKIGRGRVLDLCPSVLCFLRSLICWMSFRQKGLIILLLKSGPSKGPSRMIPYSPIKFLQFSLQPIRRRYQTVVVVAYKKAVIWPRALAAEIALDLFLSLQRQITVCRVGSLRFVGQENIILRTKSFLFTVQTL